MKRGDVTLMKQGVTLNNKGQKRLLVINDGLGVLIALVVAVVAFLYGRRRRTIRSTTEAAKGHM